ncbi:AraC family transcriptional regulator [Paenibacillus filicis]|uniref:AraC family transcriptional regulator n=1 Tax=Paenibacillus gyeongsangnamensis TaxID=3388067 RepID=A0ABT4Q7D0_9BACL|nr:AraC family transcriptional regulator [Paenibacillus filicis]MCZ8512692.1 AraC family transcriptional regulator [Paenibacillus filicis]
MMSFIQFYVPPLPHYIVSGLARVPEGFRHPNRNKIGVFDLLVVCSGTLYIGEEKQQWRLESGDSVILRPDKPHYGTAPCTEPTEYYWLHFQTAGHWSETVSDSWQRGGERIEPGDTEPGGSREELQERDEEFFLATFPIKLSQYTRLPRLPALTEKLQRLAYLEEQTLSRNKWQHQLVFQEILQELAAAQTRGSDGPAVQVAEQAATYLRIHYKEPISYAELGAALSFHPAYISRCMNKVFGLTPLEYLTRYRLEQAKLMLLNTDLPIGRIAEEAGFNQASYFGSCFARTEGMTPRMYRKQYMQKEEDRDS